MQRDTGMAHPRSRRGPPAESARVVPGPAEARASTGGSTGAARPMADRPAQGSLGAGRPGVRYLTADGPALRRRAVPVPLPLLPDVGARWGTVLLVSEERAPMRFLAVLRAIYQRAESRPIREDGAAEPTAAPLVKQRAGTLHRRRSSPPADTSKRHESPSAPRKGGSDHGSAPPDAVVGWIERRGFVRMRGQR